MINRKIFYRVFFISLIFFSVYSNGKENSWKFFFFKKTEKADLKDQKIKTQTDLKDQQQPLYSKKSVTKTLKTLLVEKKASVPFKVELVAENLGVPWGMVFLNKEELILTEREGQIKKIHIPTGKITSISGVPKVYAQGQGGLLDIALHPDFKKNRWVYFTYSLKKGRKQTTALARGQLKNNRIIKLKTLFKAQPFYSASRHFGSRLVFDDQGFLFMTVGDRTKKHLAQSVSNHFGKVLRLDDQGRPAKGNPFEKLKGARPEIWSFGHRNPQGLFIHPETKELWLQEHGPKGGDEINLIKKGANYGWPIITYGKSYAGFKIGEGTHRKGMEQPVKYWTPSIAPCGLLIYSGKRFPQWKGDFFSGSLVLTHLNQLKISNKKVLSEKRRLSSLGFRFRHVIEGPQGFIWAGVDQGLILKISDLK